jgi:hypothetical protein
MVVHNDIGPHPDPDVPRLTLAPGVRLAHLLTLAAAGIYLVYLATKQSFYLDEWDFLAYRGIHFSGSEGLFVPHNEHWTTIPILIWRGLFNVVGVRHYWLYALPMIIAHLVVVSLLWRLMLRHRVEPWVATLLAAAFAVLGAGSGNITSAFQIAFVGSVAFGFLAIEAIERDRFWLASVWGIAALMCSNIGVPMVLGCALVALVRRRYAGAAVAVIPPALTFVIWYVLIGHVGTYASTDIASLSLNGLASYVYTGLTTSMSGLIDGSPNASAVLVHVLGTSIVIVLAVTAVVRRNVPAALALTTVAFYIFVGLGRLQYGTGQAAASRYSYIALALCLPLIGQLITTLVRNRVARPIALSGLVALVAVNAVVLLSQANLTASSRSQETAQIQAAAFLIHSGARILGQRTTSDAIGPPNMPGVTALTGLVRDGQYPVPAEVAPAELRAERAVTGVFQSATPGYPNDLTIAGAGPTACVKISAAKSAAVPLPGSGSLRLENRPGAVPNVTVSYPAVPNTPGTLTVIPIPPGDSWLNVPASAYRTAVIKASIPVRLCDTVAGSSAQRTP